MLYSNQHGPTQLSKVFILHLQSIGQSLVHLGDLGGNAQVDGAATDVNDESTDEVGVNLGDVRKKKKRALGI
jgi:hypothetical protein